MAPTLTLPASDLDDLIYFSRTGDLPSLQSSITDLSQTHSTPVSAIIRAAIDIDDEGLGSRACLLHYPAANGNLEIVSWILSQTTAPQDDAKEADTNAHTNGANGTAAIIPRNNEAVVAFINHQNVSGNTALHWAGINGHLDIVKALISAGADPEIVNGAGRDAVVESEWSSKDGAAECAVWMLGECGGLEKGVGGGEVGEGEAEDEVMGDDAQEVKEEVKG